MELEYALEWFNYAITDLSSAEFLLSMYPLPIEIICYHCQQSAEKFLKGFLIYSGVSEPPKTHNLIILHDMCLEKDKQFIEISRACEALNRYGVQLRYPNEMEILENDMRKAIEYARFIRDFELISEIRNEYQTKESDINNQDNNTPIDNNNA